MADADQITSLFADTNIFQESKFASSKYVQVSDQQGNSYAGGQISFNLESNKSQLTILADSYIVLPLRITNSVATSRYAVKNSVLSFIQGCQVTTAAGVTLVNEQQGQTPIMANLRLLIDSSIDFHSMNELQYFGRDNHCAPDASGRDLSSVGYVNPDVSSGYPDVNPLFNKALANRIVAFASQAGAIAGGAQDFIVYIPLRFIHSFFAAMDWPCLNCPFVLTFNVSGVTGSGYQSFMPMTSPDFPKKLTLGPVKPVASVAAITAFADTEAAAVATAAAPQLEIRSSVSQKGFTSGVKLMLKVVTLAESDSLALASKIKAGYQRSVTWLGSQYYVMPQAASGQASYSINQLIGSSIVKPTRLWVLPVVKDTLSKADNTFPAAVSTVGQYLTNCDILINNMPLFGQQKKSQYEFYHDLREQFVGNGVSMQFGSPISYTDFLKGSSYYCFDLSRNATINSNVQCSLTLATDIGCINAAGAPTTVPALDVICIVEHVMTGIFSISESGVSLLVKQGDLPKA